MKRFISRKNLNGAVGLIVIIALIIGIVALLVSVFGGNTKQISSTSFAIGALDVNGEFRKSDKSLYSKEPFCCQGLKIEKAFESKSRYEIYYYREDNSFIGSTDIITDHSYEKGNSVPNAMYARVVITPVLEADEKLSFLNKGTYAREFKITVSSDQTFEPPLKSIFPNVKQDYYSSASDDYLILLGNITPFVFVNDVFSSKTIKEISVPVAGVKDHFVESKLTVFVVEMIPTGQDIEYRIVSSHELKLPAMTFTESLGTINSDNFYPRAAVPEENWLTWDVNIRLKENQTLAFFDETDTIYISSCRDYDQKYDVYGEAFLDPTLEGNGLFVDVKYLE